MYIFIYIYFRNTPKAQVILQNPGEAGGRGDEEGESTPKHRTNVSAYDESTEAQERKKESICEMAAGSEQPHAVNIFHPLVVNPAKQLQLSASSFMKDLSPEGGASG